MTRRIRVETDCSFEADEYAALLAATQGGDAERLDAASVHAALSAYHFVGHVRDDLGMLVGLVCAFSDGVFATFTSDLLVHPSARRCGVGSALLAAVERRFPGVPVFAAGFDDNRAFFLRRGYTRLARPMEIFGKLDRPGGSPLDH